MIKLIEKKEGRDIFNVLAKDKFQNPYLYIDALSFGFTSEKIETFLQTGKREEVCAILYKYYNSFQLFKAGEIDYAETASFLSNDSPEMISGASEVLSRLAENMPEYSLYTGVIMAKSTVEGNSASDLKWARKEDCAEIARLICSDDKIGGHYTEELLTEQLQSRMAGGNCRNLIAVREKRIVAHMGTYTDCGGIAVLGGLITDEKYRGQGLGKAVLNRLADSVIEEEKTPVLYCFDPDTVQWYKRNGWTEINTCAKLERKR